MGALGCAGLYYGGSYVRQSGVDARTDVSAERKELFQRALALHAAGVDVPAGVRTWAEAAEFAAMFRRRLAHEERSKIDEIRSVIKQDAVRNPE